MKHLRPPVAFALGLWLGALVAGAAGWVWFQSWQSSTTSREQVIAADAGQQVSQLRADNSHLKAENDRLRETLKSYREEFAEVPAAIEAPSASPAVAVGNKPSEEGQPTLAQLEARAVQNDVAAVTALGEASPQDHGKTLLRVWASDKLDFPCQRTAIWFLANLVEADPKLADAVRACFANAETDPEIWLSALDGLTTPAPAATDYRTRVNLLVELEDSAAPSMRPQIENARKRLLREWAESESNARP